MRLSRHAFPQVDYTDTVRRPSFDELPVPVQAAIGEACGSTVVRAEDPPGSGFTGGFAAVVHLADGRSVFAKAGSSVNPHLVGAYAQEAMVLQQLPPAVPAPRFVGALNLPPGEVDEREWQVVIAEAVTGALPQPWTEESLAVVHEACLACADALTPGPSSLELPTLAGHFGSNPMILATFPDLQSSALELTWGQPAWLPSRYTELAELVGTAADRLVGETACHGDLRADNTLIVPASGTRPARAVLVDWNWLMRGPVWTDFVGVLPLARADGVDVEAWLTRSPLTASVDPASIDALLATIAAYMLGSAATPAPSWTGWAADGAGADRRGGPDVGQSAALRRLCRRHTGRRHGGPSDADPRARTERHRQALEHQPACRVDSATAARAAPRVMPASPKASATLPSASRIRPSSMCSVPISLCPNAIASRRDSSSTFLAPLLNGMCPAVQRPGSCSGAPSSASTRRTTSSASIPMDRSASTSDSSRPAV